MISIILLIEPNAATNSGRPRLQRRPAAGKERDFGSNRKQPRAGVPGGTRPGAWSFDQGWHCSRSSERGYCPGGCALGRSRKGPYPLDWCGAVRAVEPPRKWESDDALCRGSRCGAAIRTRIILDQRGRIVGFAKLYDPVPIHTDKEAAARGPFGGLIASGFNTLAIYQRLIVEAVWTQVAGIVGRSFEVRLSRPMRPGTIITGYSKSKASPSDQSAATES